MGIEARAEVKFQIIQETLNSDNNLLNVSWLCKFAGVSRSGYYNWVKNETKRFANDEQDKRDFAHILNAFQYRGYSKGARSIYMHLLHLGIRMNLKKIRRLMKKFSLKCPVRQANPYRRMAKALKTNTIADNVVARNFHSRGARKILLTDITYLFFGDSCCYLSTILDAFTHEILAYQLSNSLMVDFVINTVDQLIENYGAELDDEAVIHSDQGCHYTSYAFINKLKEVDFVQSMSRKGNCWDNSPQESFFGHMKDEIRFEIKKCKNFDDVKLRVDDWMDYYNHDRYQWDLLKLSPCEYFEYIQTGFYPLEKYYNT